MDFSHFDEQGNAWMVDVGGKEETKREATARGSIFMSPECLKMVKEGSMKKGDVLGVARVAGIMGAKRTSELIPLCHLLNLTKLTVDFTIHGPYHRTHRRGDGSADRSECGPPYHLRYVQGSG